MIRRDLQGDWFLITQPEHARVSGFLAHHWGRGDFTRSGPWDEIRLAAAEHDNGWREWDDQPSLNPAGKPALMYENEIADVFEILERGLNRLMSGGHLYPAALVSLHYANWATDVLTGVRSGQWPVTPELRAKIETFKADEEERRADICGELRERKRFQEAVTPDGIHRNGRFVWTFDMLSLILCCRWTNVTSLKEVPSGEGFCELRVERVEELILRVAPWPFDADSLEFAVRGRRFPAKPFRDASEFRDAYGHADDSEILFRIVPG